MRSQVKLTPDGVSDLQSAGYLTHACLYPICFLGTVHVHSHIKLANGLL
jgi:hypothetical protein